MPTVKIRGKKIKLPYTKKGKKRAMVLKKKLKYNTKNYGINPSGGDPIGGS